MLRLGWPPSLPPFSPIHPPNTSNKTCGLGMDDQRGRERWMVWLDLDGSMHVITMHAPALLFSPPFSLLPDGKWHASKSVHSVESE
jgi:hypothetical protein